MSLEIDDDCPACGPGAPSACADCDDGCAPDVTTDGQSTCQPAPDEIKNRTENHHGQPSEQVMKTRHLTSVSACSRSHGETDNEPSAPTLPQRVPGAALAALMLADFANAVDAAAPQRMPSRAEVEAARDGLLALAIHASTQPEESTP